MRVTNSLMTDSLLSNIETSLTNLNDVQRQIATGKRLNRPSDDPSGASLAIALRGTMIDNLQYQRDADQAKGFLVLSDSALSDVSGIIMSARQIASQGANSTQTAESQQALAEQVDGLIRQVTNIANTEFHGKYLFSGTQTKTPPYTQGDATHAYAGNNGKITSTIGPNDVLSLNSPGIDIFGGTQTTGGVTTTTNGIFAALESLKSNLASGNMTGMSNNIGDLDASLNSLSTARSVIGAKINEVDTVKSRLTRSQGEYQEAIANVEEVDLAEAYVQMQSAQNVYQASLVTTAKSFQYSLADYL